MSKGSKQRPSQVPTQKVRDNWDKVFSKTFHNDNTWSEKPANTGKIQDDKRH